MVGTVETAAAAAAAETIVAAVGTDYAAVAAADTLSKVCWS